MIVQLEVVILYENCVDQCVLCNFTGLKPISTLIDGYTSSKLYHVQAILGVQVDCLSLPRT